MIAIAFLGERFSTVALVGLGLGVAGSLGSLGLKLEAAGYGGERVDQPGGDRHEQMLIAAVEGYALAVGFEAMLASKKNRLWNSGSCSPL